MQTIYSNAPENQDVTFPLQTKIYNNNENNCKAI